MCAGDGFLLFVADVYCSLNPLLFLTGLHCLLTGLPVTVYNGFTLFVNVGVLFINSVLSVGRWYIGLGVYR